MNTTRRNLTLVAIGLIACLGLAGCGSDNFGFEIEIIDEVKGGGEITMVEQSLEGSFSKIEICCHLSVDISDDPEANESVQITTNENLHELLVVTVENDTLVFSGPESTLLATDDPIELHISGHEITGLEVWGESEVSGELSEVDEMDILVGDFANVKMSVDSPSLTVNTEKNGKAAILSNGETIEAG